MYSYIHLCCQNQKLDAVILEKEYCNVTKCRGATYKFSLFIN